jgi:uncharacterized protein (TIGR02996 family)
MTDDRAFLRAIAAEPEEQGDPRAEYLRLAADQEGAELRQQRRARLEDRRLEIHVAVEPRDYLHWLEDPDGTHAECEAIDAALLDMERADLRSKLLSARTPHFFLPGETMNDDRDFLRAIAAEPEDDTLRLAYADWLEEQGDPRAEYLRLEADQESAELRQQRRARLEDRHLEIQVAVEPRDYILWLEDPGGTHAECEAIDAALLDMERADLRSKLMSARLDELRRQADPRWLALIDRPPVENCEVQFKFRCPKQWQRLTATEDSQVRFCDACRKNVYYCGTVDEARAHARQGRCVAVRSGQRRCSGDLEHEPGDFLEVDLGPGHTDIDDEFEEDLLGMIVDDEYEPDRRDRPWWKFW